MKKKATSIIVFALCVVITLATAVNVFGDNKDVQEMAKQKACWNVEKCNYSMTSEMRTPIGQNFTFQSANSRPIEVTCRRAAIVFGDYSCEADK